MMSSTLTPESDSAFEVLENSLRFRWVAGDVTTVAKGYTTRQRVLPYAIIAQPIGGSALLRIRGEPDRIIESRSAVFVRPNVAHEFIAQHSYLRRWAHFTCTIFGALDIFSFFRVPYLVTGATAEEIGTLCQGLAEGPEKAGRHPLITACSRQGSGLSLVSVLLASSGAESTYHDFLASLARLRPVFQRLDGDLASAITRDSLAALVHLSPTRFHTVFKGITGVSPMHYVKRVRMQRARELLVSTFNSIAEVAQAVGYGDQFHFSHEFKKAFRTSPLQYRQQVTNERQL